MLELRPPIIYQAKILCLRKKEFGFQAEKLDGGTGGRN